MAKKYFVGGIFGIFIGISLAYFFWKFYDLLDFGVISLLESIGIASFFWQSIIILSVIAIIILAVFKRKALSKLLKAIQKR